MKKFKDQKKYEYIFENKEVRLLVIVKKQLPKDLLFFSEIIGGINLILDNIKDYGILHSNTTIK